MKLVTKIKEYREKTGMKQAYLISKCIYEIKMM